MDNAKISRYGVYRDLTASPYEFTSPYGDVFKFSRRKRLEMYQRELPSEIKRLRYMIERHDMADFINEECMNTLLKAVYRSLYRKIER